VTEDGHDSGAGRYDAAVEYITGRPRFSPEPGLARMRSLLRELGDPHKAGRCVHVAGTNGKGSTSAFLASIAGKAGLRTGLYTSPHLEHLEERIAVDGEPVLPGRLVELVSLVAPAVRSVEERTGEPVIEFELLTALAFVHFRDEGCEVSVLEVGLGGKFDATNVIDPPAASLVTSIGRDHTEVLGDSPGAIASEKAGVIKTGSLVVTAVRDREPLSVLEQASRDRGAELWTVGPSDGVPEPAVRWTRTEFDVNGQTFDLFLPGGEVYRNLRIRMAGAHQVDNAACAVAAAEGMRRSGLVVPEEAVRSGLAGAFWPGRFELVRRKPWIVVDGAHNPEGAAALAGTYSELFGERRATVVLGVLTDKEAGPVISSLAGVAGHVIVTSPTHPTRALPAEVLSGLVREAGLAVEVAPAAREAIALGARRLRAEDDVLLITGSLYLAGEARRELRRAGLLRPSAP